MPMLKRAIEPSDISQSQVDTEIKNELECVANNTLACIIQQLSSLSKHSEDLFGELYAETYAIAARTSNLSTRIEKLKHKIVQLNPTVEEVLLQEINLKKPFKSSLHRDQQIMVRSTRPLCVNEVYMLCEAPPNLSELDVFREDGKSSLKFYTDPNYFVELWYSEMKAAQHQQKKPKHKQGQVHKNKPKALRTPKNKIEEFKDFRHGPEFVDNFRKQNSCGDGSLPNGVNVTVYHSTEFGSHVDHQQYNELSSEFLDDSMTSEVGNRVENEEKNHIRAKSNSLMHISSPRPMCPPPAPPKMKHPVNQLATDKQSNSPIHFANTGAVHLDEPDSSVRMSPSSNFHLQEESFCGDNSLPPPPPSPHRARSYSPTDYQHQLPSPPNVSQMSGDDSLGPLPPPPPLPDSLLHDVLLPQLANDSKDRMSIEPDAQPPLNANRLFLSQLDQESPASNSSSATCSISVQDALKVNHMMDKGPLIRDTRSDLLAAIREGIQLRKVEEHRLKSEQNKKSATLDVQSIMEAAFEMRRKALEENDSENEEEDEANWSD